jgi:hypothetical protein
MWRLSFDGSCGGPDREPSAPDGLNPLRAPESNAAAPSMDAMILPYWLIFWLQN